MAGNQIQRLRSRPGILGEFLQPVPRHACSIHPIDGNSTSLLCQLVTALGQSALCGAFTINILMSQPDGYLRFPAGATDSSIFQISVGGKRYVHPHGRGHRLMNRTNPNADVFYPGLALGLNPAPSRSRLRRSRCRMLIARGPRFNRFPRRCRSRRSRSMGAACRPIRKTLSAAVTTATSSTTSAAAQRLGDPSRSLRRRRPRQYRRLYPKLHSHRREFSGIAAFFN